MKATTSFTLKAAALGALFAVCGAAGAQTTNDGPNTWAFSLGYNNISPQQTEPLSAPSIPNSSTNPANDAQPIFNIIYNFTDHISAQFALGTPYKHDLYGSGALQGTGKLGSVEQLPPTLFVQWHFMDATAPMRPYVGLGATFAYFRDEKGSGTLTALSNPGGPPTTFTIDNAWGVTPQLGLTYNFNQRWFADVSIAKTFIDTTVHLSTGQKADAPLNPVSEAISIGYRF